MARVLLENVGKIYDGKVSAVSNFNLDIADGEFMVIVGPSGCGKTTTLRMIAGLEKTTTGNIYIGDILVNDVPPKERDVAMVFQNYALYPHMTVYQNMAFALKMRNLPAGQISKRVKEVSGLLGIERLLNRKPRALSGGQRQRVALGRAIVRNPKVFLFDEPLSNLDAKLRVTTRAELKAMQHRLQSTSVYVTHDQAEAMTLGERICVMHNGVIQQVAGPMEVYERPVNTFVAGFLGTPAMNFFTGFIKLKNDTASFVIDKDTIILPQRLRTVLSDYHNKEIVLGVRPEHLSLHQFPGRINNIISATVNVVEPVGIRTDVHLTNHNGKKFVVCVGPYTKLKANDAVKMYIDQEKIHIFEPGETGKNVTISGSTLT
ncbi:MAG: sn-glycerol-3-phosphate ABC transporter ATP-binding protein UgpC [Planctomycetes bacterium]|nr:sn-glycerol-3-phosphate ABC transporter ATP-binding protein UgpC [Planctomycetota bacterium]